MTPQLRFPEFTDEWQMKKLGDIFEFKRTNSLSRAQLSEDGKVGNIHYGDIHKSLPTLLDASKVKLPMIVSSKQFNTADAIKVGDVILADAFEDYADIGKVIEVVNLNHGQELYSGLHTFLMRPAYPSAHGFNGMLFKTATIRKQLMRIATGIYVLGVSKNNVSQLVVATPSKPEQEKIADFLTAVDERIAVGEKKLELLETYKRGVMQKIFSQQVRFKDENGNPYPDWEEKKLGEVGKIITGKTPSTTDKSHWMGEVKFVTPTDMDGQKYQETSSRTVSYTGSLMLPEKSIMYTCIASIGKMSMSVGDTITNQQINSFIPSSKICNEFAYYNLLWLTPRIISTQSNNTLPIINKSEFSKFKIFLPSWGEQQKIANFLTTLDDKITAEKSKLTAARQFKKALLQRMFV